MHTVTIIYNCDGTTTQKQHTVVGDRVIVFTAGQTYKWQNFAGWYINDELVCPNLKYVVFVDSAITVTVKYSDSITVTPRPIVETPSFISDYSSGTNKLVHLTLHNVPDEYTVIGYGTIYSTRTADPSELIIENVDGSNVRKVEKSGSQNGLMTTNINVGSSVNTVVNVRGYVTVRDTDGNVMTYYSEILSGSFNSLSDDAGNESGSGGI